MTLLELKPNQADSIAHAIRHACEPLPDPAHMIEFGASFDPYIGGSKVVLLGEASHGTSEFYQARAARRTSPKPIHTGFDDAVRLTL